MIKFKLLGTQAENDAEEGFGVLVVRKAVPQLFIPIPKENIDNWESIIRIDPENIEEITKTTRVYSGEVKDLAFVADNKLF